MADIPERLATALADRYRIERELGQGGMATVYLANDVRHERQVAVKVMREDLAAVLGTERFLREIKTVASLHHPNILQLYDSGEANGLLYFVMPFVEGESLRDRLDRDEQMPVDEALQIAREVADALGLAHSHGIIHRDIKPENILLVSGHAVVADFGIARAVSSAGGDQLTQTGMAIGTPAYMSPEQAAGDSKLDGRSDLYALGCVLYEMLAGHPPFTGSPREVIARHAVDPVPPLKTARPSVSAEVDSALTRVLEKVPADRFATAHQLIEALEGQTTAVTARPVSTRTLTAMGVYLLGVAAAFFTTAWIADQFTLSPHLPPFVATTLLLLVPAVFFVTSGAPGLAWRRAGVTVNVIAAMLVLALLFRGKDLGAATVEVTLTDEEGNTIERVIPKAEFRKRVAIFNFEADPADTAAHWLQYGVPYALVMDLFQDLFIDTRNPLEFGERLRRAGIPEMVDVPLSLKREIAGELFREQFVAGTVATEGDEFVLTMSVYETERGRPLRESTVRGANVFELIDQLSLDIRGTLDIPEGYSSELSDLPVAELLTESQAAFRPYAEAIRAIQVDDDWAAAVPLLQAATREDPTFADAHHSLFQVYLFTNQPQAGMASIQAAMDHLYRMPERAQNLVKSDYYFARQEQQKAIAVIEMNAELFPTDLTALQGLLQIQLLQDKKREAVGTLERVLELDPYQHQALRQIGGIYEQLGEFDTAIERFTEYAELYPDDERSFLDIGDLRRTMGEHDAAVEAYDRALLLEPGRVGITTRLAAVARDLGDFATAERHYEDALSLAKTVRDSVAALASFGGYQEFRGRLREALTIQQRVLALSATFQPPFVALSQQLGGLGDYVLVGDTAYALNTLETIRAQLQPPMDLLLPMGELMVYLALEDPERIEAAIAGVEQFIEQFSYQVFKPIVAYARGRLHELRGEYREAIASWEEDQQLNPTDETIDREIGRAYRQLGELQVAEEHLLQASRVVPADPETNYELALVYEALGRTEEALERVRRATEVWADADDGFDKAARAREKLTQLSGN